MSARNKFNLSVLWCSTTECASFGCIYGAASRATASLKDKGALSSARTASQILTGVRPSPIAVSTILVIRSSIINSDTVNTAMSSGHVQRLRFRLFLAGHFFPPEFLDGTADRNNVIILPSRLHNTGWVFCSAIIKGLHQKRNSRYTCYTNCCRLLSSNINRL